MTRDTFRALIEVTRAAEDKLLEEKGADYTRKSEDVLANFKRVAEAANLTPIQVWYVYAAKHWDALSAFVMFGEVKSEAIEGRFHDLRNYLMLGLGILAESKHEDKQQ